MIRKHFLVWLLVGLGACSGEPQPLADLALDAGVDGAAAEGGPVPDGSREAAAAPLKGMVDELVKPIMDDRWAVGLVVGLVSAQGTEFHGYGSTRLQGGTVPDEKTIFEIGSITKTFTSLLLASLAEKQTVTLDQPVQELLAGKVTVPSKNGKPILLRHLASHTSGLPRMPTNFAPADPANPYVDYTVPLLYAFLTPYTLSTEPGTSWVYSNLGAGLLGHALSLKSGRSYQALIEETITGPLGMTDTALELSSEQAGRLAQGHTDALQACSSWDFDVLAPCGALRSSVTDLLTYLAAQAGRQQTPLAAAMSTTQVSQFTISPSLSIGLGWLTTDARHVWHSGGTGGYETFAGFDNQTRNLVVVLANTITTQSAVTLLGLKLLRVLAGETPTPIDLPPTLKLAAAELEPFCGTYALEVQSSYKLTISRKDEALYVTLPNQPSYRIWPQSAEKFYSRLAPFWLTFKKSGSGVYDSLLFEQQGQPDHTYLRVP